MKYGVISAGHIKTAEAGIEILKMGGNAFDAIIAAGLASCVAEVMLTSLGGGGFLLAHTQDNKNILFDFFAHTPKNKNQSKEIDFYPIEVNFGDATQEFHIGLASMAVPGNIAGFFYVHKKLGKLPLKVVAEPAIHYARYGIELNKFQHYCLTLLGPIMTTDPEMKKIFAPNGKLLQAGAVYKMENFANTLETLVNEGEKLFYEDLAKKIIDDCDKKGGHLIREDFKNYQVIEREPLKIFYRENKILTNTPPSSGGALIAFSLKLLEKYNLRKFKQKNYQYLQKLALAMELTNAARRQNYDNKLYTYNIIEKFLGTENFKKYKINFDNYINKWGSTTHISVMDKDGNAASMTTTNGEGSGYVVSGTEIMINNMLGEEDLNPNGFHKWIPNRRISSMMSPTIVLDKNNQVKIVLGSGGSNRIRTAILQVILNIIDFDMEIDKAIESPRIHWENNVLNIEPGFPSATIEKMREFAQKKNDKIIEWSGKNMFFGGVHGIKVEKGKINGYGDKRRSGVSLKF